MNGKKLSVTLSLTALGLAIGALASFMKLPIYLDTIGIMLTTLLLGWRYGLLCSALTAGIAFFIVSAFVPFYIGTMIGVVLITEWLRNKGMYSSNLKTIVSGVIHGLVGTILSAPVTYFLFDGFTSSGNDVIVAFLNSNGTNLALSVIISLSIFAVIDRILTCLFCRLVYGSFPKSFIFKHDFRNIIVDEK